MKSSIFTNLEHKKLLYLTSFFIILQSLLTIMVAFILELLVNTASEGNLRTLLRVFIAVVIYLVAAFLITKVTCSLSNHYLYIQNIRIQEKIMRGIVQKKVGDFQKLGVGQSIALLENDVKLLETNYYSARLKLIDLCSTFLFGVIAMFVINWKIAFAVIVASMIPVIFSGIYTKPMNQLQNDYSSNYGKYTSTIKNVLVNYNLIKVFHLEKKVLEDVSENCARQENSKKKYQIRVGLAQNYSSILGFAVVFAVFGVGSLLVIQGNAKIGALLAFIQLMNYVLSPIEGISIQKGRMDSCKGIMTKMDDLMELTEMEALEDFPNHSGITLQNVSYSFADKNVLTNIVLKFELGKKYVLIGSNGSGKSTLLHIMNRFYEDYNGQVYYGETEAKEISTAQFYENVIMLQQEVLILNDTLRNNVLLYRDIDELELTDTIKRVGLEKVFAQEDELCIDNGNNMSGGEKQKIAAARALLRHPNILLLDESFSAMDPASRMEIEKVLLEAANMVIAISHDRSAENLERYDEVIYMDEGQIVAKGTYEDLKKSGILI